MITVRAQLAAGRFPIFCRCRHAPVEKHSGRSSELGGFTQFTMAHSRSRETKAPPDQVCKIWSDTSTWATWNPVVLSVSLDGPFATGTTGEMRTRAGGTHRIRLDGVEPGHRFRLETKVLPALAFSFQCEVSPVGGGSRISQAIAIRGPLGPVFSAMLGERIASSFVPLLDGLANYAETKPSPGRPDPRRAAFVL